jgi:hypothetical protein
MGAERTARRLLKEEGLDTQIVDNKGRTALQLAVEKGLSNFVELLSSH